MNLWTQSNKIIVDGSGKPIFCAACPCGTCCLYPKIIEDISVPTYYYPLADLPSTILVYDATGTALQYTLTLGVGTYVYSNGGSYPFLSAYPDPVNPWLFTPGGGTYGANCLVGIYPGGTGHQMRDTFSTTYTVTDGTNTDVVTRLNPTSCTWSGALFTLRYNASTYKWTVTGPTSGAKNAPQNQPNGTYTNGITVT